MKISSVANKSFPPSDPIFLGPIEEACVRDLSTEIETLCLSAQDAIRKFQLTPSLDLSSRSFKRRFDAVQNELTSLCGKTYNRYTKYIPSSSIDNMSKTLLDGARFTSSMFLFCYKDTENYSNSALYRIFDNLFRLYEKTIELRETRFGNETSGNSPLAQARQELAKINLQIASKLRTEDRDQAYYYLETARRLRDSNRAPSNVVQLRPSP
jgi:hypothetical protein